METDGITRLTLYSRKGCHLCDDMAAALRGLRGVRRFTLEVVDVDSSADLARQYGDRVPVLACGAHELCHARLDTAALTAFLSGIR